LKVATAKNKHLSSHTSLLKITILNRTAKICSQKCTKVLAMVCCKTLYTYMVELYNVHSTVPVCCHGLSWHHLMVILNYKSTSTYPDFSWLQFHKIKTFLFRSTGALQREYYLKDYRVTRNLTENRFCSSCLPDASSKCIKRFSIKFQNFSVFLHNKTISEKKQQKTKQKTTE
jgi:hypothetical protein